MRGVVHSNIQREGQEGKGCEIQDIIRWIRRRRREWRVHVNRVDEDRLPKVVKMERLETARLPGRPPKRPLMRAGRQHFRNKIKHPRRITKLGRTGCSP